MAIGSTAGALTRGRLAQAGTIPGAGRRRVVRALRTVSIAGMCAYPAHCLAGFGGSASDASLEDWLFNGLLLVGAALRSLRVASRRERGAWCSHGAASCACAWP